MTKRLLMMLLALGMLAGTVTGCHTAEGAGEDIEDLGDEIEDAVD